MLIMLPFCGSGKQRVEEGSGGTGQDGSGSGSDLGTPGTGDVQGTPSAPGVLSEEFQTKLQVFQEQMEEFRWAVGLGRRIAPLVQRSCSSWSQVPTQCEAKHIFHGF